MSLTARQAALALHVTPKTIRAWIRQGAPVARAGRPLLIDLDALQQWRAGQGGDVADKLAMALLDTLRRDSGIGCSAPAALGIDEQKAARLLLVSFDRLHVALTGSESSEPLPDSIRSLRIIAGLPARTNPQGSFV